MRNLLAAEWQKMMGHRWMTGFTVWIFPVGAVGVFATFILLLFLMPDSSDRLLAGPLVWDDQFFGPWVMFGSAGGGLFIRTLPIVFCASVFAGEYGWGTWKNVLPRSNRLGLILVKFVVAVTMIMLSLLGTSIVAGVATFILSAISGQPVTPELTADVISGFLGDYLLAVALGLVVVVLITNYSALASIITKSTVGGAVAGIGFMLFEEFLLPLLNLLARLLNTPDIVQLYRITPTYNLKNATHWVQVGEPSANQFYIDLAQPDSLLFSVVMLVSWSAIMLVLTALLFQQQDITS